MTTTEQYIRSNRQRRNAKTGNISEEHVIALLRRHGYKRVEAIERAWIIKRAGGKIISAIPKKKVSGDIKAMTKDGKIVHVEVKCRQEKLLYSDFEKHQVEALSDVVKYNGIAFAAWYRNPYEIVLLRWPIKGFGPRKSITWEQAKQWSI
ncbi:hypothetical protein [Prosthecochloris sp.]|uniref:hypothetical protein n=1 Tax=Prosthecochloris sp. TaxID=290513 RepID=UPI0025DEF64A|nr:hypothetical protein [Prosthecochloris sp.]